ncbi:MAG: hypothetical protein GQ531_00020 [Sulfurovum sp.]|nr:hypothetical protein [Sulfurovum sp.]
MNKIKFDISENRELEIQLHDFKNIDIEYVFYYDETNNIRKFWLKNESIFNIPIENLSKNFVLGGVSHLTENIDFDTATLKNNLNLQSNIKEIKLKHIAKGDFLSCLKSTKLETFLDWLISKDLFIHYSNLNILYWSCIDILESILPQEFFEIHMELKTILYELIKIDLNNFISILYKYEYPNIDRKKANYFLDEILSFIKSNKPKFISKHPFIDTNLVDLIYSIIENSKNTELTFIMDEESHVLIDDLSIFYKRPFGIFKNSKHIFDEESSIQDVFNKWSFFESGKEWENFEFQNSETNDLIQVSDIIIGLLGKLFEYLNDVSFDELNKINSILEAQQINNFDKILILIDKSDSQSTAFIHSIHSLIERDKLVLLLTNLNK